MMKSSSPLLDSVVYSSLLWHESEVSAGVRFAIRQISLAQRIELTKQVRQLTLKNEFLRGGTNADQLEAGLGELLARRVYLEWGLAELTGLTIDGAQATPEMLIEKGPEKLSNEIAKVILASLRLSDEEIKNF